MARNKVGFHIGSQANATGYGDYIRALDAAGIPAVCMSVGGEGIGDIVGCWDNGSTVPHIVVVRYMPPPGHPDGSQDVPRYDMTPEAAFVRFWAWVKPLIGPDVKRYSPRIVIKVGNELDKGQSEWLADFYLVGHDIMQSDPDGPFRMGAFGFASGEPEPEHWRGPRMLDYLRLCADDPIGASVVLHEYSYADTLQSGYPFLIGRFQDLFAACDENGIKRPYVYIHEGGWRQDVMPPVNEAMSQLPWAAELYAKFPEIKGAGLWTLQGSGSYGNPHISKLAQPMIEPIKNYTLTAEFPDPPEEPQQPPDGEEPPMDCNPRVPYSRKYLVAPQDAALEEWIAICEAAFPGRNSVTFSYDDAGHAPGVTSNTAVLHGIPLELRQSFIDWYALHYPGTAVQFAVDAPPAPLVNIINIVDQLPLAKARFSRTLDQIDAIAIHHFASNSTIQQVHDYHKSLGWPGIGYHFVVDHGGEIYQTIPLDKLGTHVANNNTRSIGVALRGNFTNQAPAQAMLDSARVLVTHLKQLVPAIDEALGHRQFPGASTQCPGNTWAFWLPYVAGGEIAQPGPPPPPPPPAPTIDAAPYFVPSGQYGHKVVMEVGEGTQPMQLEKRANDVVLRKGDGNWIDGKRYQDSEQWRVKDGQIQKGIDTSDAGNGGKDGYDLGWAQWIPQFVQVGQTYHSTPVVKRFNRTMNCQVFSEIQANDFLHIKALVPTWVSPANPNIILNNILIVEWRSGTPDLNVAPNEIYYFAVNMGYVGWGSHFILEIAEGQAPLTGALDCGM